MFILFPDCTCEGEYVYMCSLFVCEVVFAFVTVCVKVDIVMCGCVTLARLCLKFCEYYCKAYLLIIMRYKPCCLNVIQRAKVIYSITEGLQSPKTVIVIHGREC